MSEAKKRSTAPVRASAASARLAQMTAEQRRRAAADFNRAERAAWAARYPNEVPLVNGELAWIALDLADLD